MRSSYHSPKVATRRNDRVDGLGMFAKERIEEGEIVCVKGGNIISKKNFDELSVIVQQHAMQIEDQIYLGPISESEIERNSMFLNHSCNPNLGIKGQIVFVATRNVDVGEELSIDYAMMYANEIACLPLSCKCGSSECRGEIAHTDWQNAELQEKYGEFFVDFIVSKIKLDHFNPANQS